MHINQITGQIIDSAIQVHRVLGPGLLESAYEACLTYELRRRGLEIATQVGVPVVYEEVRLEVGYRLDIVVQQQVIVEIKAVEALAPIHIAQLLSYLKLTDKRVGLLINFHVPRLKDGIRRIANKA